MNGVAVQMANESAEKRIGNLFSDDVIHVPLNEEHCEDFESVLGNKGHELLHHVVSNVT